MPCCSFSPKRTFLPVAACDGGARRREHECRQADDHDRPEWSNLQSQQPPQDHLRPLCHLAQQVRTASLGGGLSRHGVDIKSFTTAALQCSPDLRVFLPTPQRLQRLKRLYDEISCSDRVKAILAGQGKLSTANKKLRVNLSYNCMRIGEAIAFLEENIKLCEQITARLEQAE